MTKSNISTIWNWLNQRDTQKIKYAHEAVMFYSNTYKEYKIEEEKKLSIEIKRIKEVYEPRIKAKRGCGGCKSSVENEMNMHIDSKVNEYAEINKRVNNYMNGAIIALSKISFEKFKTQGYTLSEINTFTIDNVGKPKKKSWESIYEVYANYQPS